jgi:hypothetical protein
MKRGYLLLPGSTIDGRSYTRANDRPITFAPPWIVEKLKAAKERNDAAGKRIVEEDDTAIELATNWMLKHAPTAEEGNRDNTAYKVVARVYDYGVTNETALEIMLEWNETKCFPPLDMEDIERVTESASRSRENAIGSRHPEAGGFEAHAIAEHPAPATRETGVAVSTKTAAKATPLKAVPLAPFFPADIPPRPWIIPGFACRGRVTMLAGPGGCQNPPITSWSPSRWPVAEVISAAMPSRSRIAYGSGIRRMICKRCSGASPQLCRRSTSHGTI